MMELRPMVIDENNIVLGGNMRLKALAELGYKEVPENWVKKASDLTPDEARRFIIADNVGFGEHDWDVLANEWDAAELADWGLDIPDFALNAPEAEEDDYEIPDEIKTDIVLGDLFEIGAHRLLCGDSTDSDAVAKLMNGKKGDSCITSPPYNQGGGKGDLFSHGKRNESLYMEDTDNKTKEEYFKFCHSILNNALIILNDVHSVVWNISYNAKSRDDYSKIIFSELNPFNVQETIIWNKGGSINLPQVGIYSRKCELVFIMSNYEGYLTSQVYGDCRWNYWETKKINQLETHKATFSIEFASRAITEFTTDGCLIYEPFTGSGTTMVAAHQLNRKCYGMELDPKYCQVIIDRMLKLQPDIEIKKNGQPY